MNPSSCEKISYKRLPNLGVDVLSVDRSNRLWKTVHNTYTVCINLPGMLGGGEWVYRGRRYDALINQLMLMEPGKDAVNRQRHGIGFVEAQGLWDGPHVVIPAKNVMGENRSLIVGMLRSKVFAAVFTVRGRAVRLISCHRADSKLDRFYRESVHD